MSLLKLFGKHVHSVESSIPPAALGLGICEEEVIFTERDQAELTDDLAALATPEVVEFPEDAERFYF